MALPGMAVPAGVPCFKLILVGDGGTGAPSCAFLTTPPLTLSFATKLRTLHLSTCSTTAAAQLAPFRALRAASRKR